MAEENTIQEEQQPTGIQFEDIVPWIDGSGDTGLSARLKLKRNFDKIKLLLEQQGAQQGGGVLTQPLTVNYKPNVGYLNGNAGITYNIGTPIETILRNILFQDMVADLSVSVSPSSPTAGTRVTLTATFTPGTTGKTVTGWQWFVDSSETAVEGATDRTFTPIETSGTHQYKVVATLSDGSTMMVTTNVTWQTQRATLTLTPSSREAEVGDNVTFDINYTPGTTGVSSPSYTTSVGTISGNTLTVQATAGLQQVTVKAMDGSTELCSAQVEVTGYYKWFAGKVDALQISQLSFSDLTTSGKFVGTSGNPYEFKVNNYRQIAIAIPQNSTVSKWIDVASNIDLMIDQSAIEIGTMTYQKSNKVYNVVLFCAERYSGAENDSTFRAYIV